MPVLSTRRYSSSYLTPSSSSSSSVGTYRSNYSSLSSSNASSTKDTTPSTSRYNYGESSYRSTYRPSYTSGISTGSSSTSSYRSRYDYEDSDKTKSYSSSTLSSRIGVSNIDTLPPLPRTTSSVTTHNYAHSNRSLSRSRDQKEPGYVGSSKNSDRSSTCNGKLSLMNDLDFYEKYSPSRYMTKYELSRSLSEASPAPTSDASSSLSSLKNNETQSHTPKSEVCLKSNHKHSLHFTILSCFLFNSECSIKLANNPLTSTNISSPALFLFFLLTTCLRVFSSNEDLPSSFSNVY
jgi:hypothetical protein